MGLFNIFKKRGAPTELPSLALPDQLSPLKQNAIGASSLERAFAHQLPPMEQAQLNAFPKFKPLPIPGMQPIPAVNTKPLPIMEKQTDDKGFFKELIKDLTEEVNSEKLDTKYKEKILADDIVSQMKTYWEQQKPEVFLQNAGGELKAKLIEKADKLNALEKDWQGAYFNLVAKEEKIRQEERELKQMLSELINIYESSLTNRKAEQSVPPVQ
jgi:hypothetical protein